MPKVPRPAQAAERHRSLAEEYSPIHALKQKSPKKRNRRDEGDEDNVINTKASRQILKIGQELADEDEAERRSRYVQAPNPAFDFNSRLENDIESDEEETGKYDDEEAWGDEEEVVEVEVIYAFTCKS
jgi:essential nuclear protein 1